MSTKTCFQPNLLRDGCKLTLQRVISIYYMPPQSPLKSKNTQTFEVKQISYVYFVTYKNDIAHETNWRDSCIKNSGQLIYLLLPVLPSGWDGHQNILLPNSVNSKGWTPMNYWALILSSCTIKHFSKFTIFHLKI